MTRQAGGAIENQFTKGLITEATGLNFPDSAVLETWNCRFTKISEVKRRLGFDAEDGTTDISGTFRNGVARSFLWKNAGNTDNTYLVTQTGQRINFFLPDSDGIFSGGLQAFGFNLATYKTEGTAQEIGQAPASFASGDGRLFIVHRRCEPIVIEYDEDTDTVSISTFAIEIRDFDGVEDGLEVDENPSTLSDAHKYNLYNQGWYPDATKNIEIKDLPDSLGLLAAYFTRVGAYPDNTEQWWVYRNSDDRFQPKSVGKFDYGNSEAPKGHYIYDAFNMDRESKSGISGIENFISVDRPSVIAFYAGRTWFGGIDDKVYYSQVIRDEKNWGKCHQKNDPTSENLSDLLDTDGGVIKIFGMGRATSLFASGSNLLIFSTNGIWVISGSGSEGTGFVATDFSIRRISTVNLLSSDSIVDVEGAPVWWNVEGIWGIQTSQTGSVQVASLSTDTIKTFLDENAPATNRSYAQGAYNPSDRIIQWLFRSTAATTVREQYSYDRILEFNVTTGAFYPHKWDIDDLAINSIFCATSVRSNFNSTEVVANDAGTTVVAGVDTVVATAEAPSAFSNAAFKMFTYTTDLLTFVEETDSAYVDFDTILGTGVDYNSYFITGAMVHGEGRDQTMEYVYVYCKSETNGSIKLHSRWDWANSETTSKWSTPQECYTSQRTHRDVSRKRLLIRGTGPAVQFYFKSVTGKPFTVIGWSTFETADQRP